MDKKEKTIGSLIIAFICIIFLLVGYVATKPSSTITEEVTSTDKKGKDKENVLVDNSKQLEDNSIENEYKTIVVEIKGEIKKPSVYEMKYGSRVYELIEKAGGYTDKADTVGVNASMKLKDEDCIVIYGKGESPNNNTKNNIRTNISSNSSDSDKIDINLATKEELKTLPGVGEVTAQKIIEYRENNGGFSSVEDITKIDRIGEKTLSKFKDKIKVR